MIVNIVKKHFSSMWAQDKVRQGLFYTHIWTHTSVKLCVCAGVRLCWLWVSRADVPAALRRTTGLGENAYRAGRYIYTVGVCQRERHYTLHLHLSLSDSHHDQSWYHLPFNLLDSYERSETSSAFSKKSQPIICCLNSSTQDLKYSGEALILSCRNGPKLH